MRPPAAEIGWPISHCSVQVAIKLRRCHTAPVILPARQVLGVRLLSITQMGSGLGPFQGQLFEVITDYHFVGPFHLSKWRSGSVSRRHAPPSVSDRREAQQLLRVLWRSTSSETGRIPNSRSVKV